MGVTITVFRSAGKFDFWGRISDVSEAGMHVAASLRRFLAILAVMQPDFSAMQTEWRKREGLGCGPAVETCIVERLNVRREGRHGWRARIPSPQANRRSVRLDEEHRVVAQATASGAEARRLDKVTAMAPSPTAEAQRLTEPCRTSPAANTPGMFVSI